MPNITPNGGATSPVASTKAKRAAALTVAINVQNLDDAAIEAQASALADAWDAGLVARVEFAYLDAIPGANAPMGRLPNDVRRNIARFDAAMRARGYDHWIDRISDDAARAKADGGPDDKIKRNTLRRILELFDEDTMRHTRPCGRRDFQNGDSSGDPIIDLALSAEHVLALHGERIALIDRALNEATPEEQDTLHRMRAAEFEAMLIVVGPFDKDGARIRALAVSTFCRRAAVVKTAEEAQAWLEIGERILSGADLLTASQLAAATKAVDALLALTRQTAN